MTVLVIGGAGYIGSHIVKALIKNGYETIVFDNFSSGFKENINPKARSITGDIMDKVALNNAMQHNVDAVIHLAAKKAVGESMENPQKYSDNNITGAINILNAMVDNNVKNIVFSSSAAVYGIPKYLPVDEKHPTNPINFYGFTKLEIEQLLGWYDKLKGIKYAALRYFNAVGYANDGTITGKEQNPQNLFPIIMEAANKSRSELPVFGDDYDTSDGTCVRDYIHVEDLSSAHLKSLEYLKEHKESLMLNLGTSKGISVKEAIFATERITGQKINYTIAPRRKGDPAIMIACADKAKAVLGWTPENSDIENIIKTMWKVYNV